MFIICLLSSAKERAGGSAPRVFVPPTRHHFSAAFLFTAVDRVTGALARKINIFSPVTDLKSFCCIFVLAISVRLTLLPNFLVVVLGLFRKGIQICAKGCFVAFSPVSEARGQNLCESRWIEC